MSLSRALAEPGSPGRAFKLTDDAAIDLLREAAGEDPSVIALCSSAGLPQLDVEEPPSERRVRYLVEHYRELRRAAVIKDPECREGVA